MRGTLEPGFSYFSDPRTLESESWFEYERFGIDAELASELALSSPLEKTPMSEAAAEAFYMADSFCNPLQAASAEGYEDIFKILPEEEDRTALQAASAEGNEDVVQILLEEGADVNALSGPDYIALIAASQNGYNRIIQLLLNAGADSNILRGDRNLNALYVAACGGHDQAVLWLLAGGANVDCLGGRESVLQAACTGGYERCVRWLLAGGLLSIKEARTERHYTVLRETAISRLSSNLLLLGLMSIFKVDILEIPYKPPQRLVIIELSSFCST
jgi:hypothetical protein